MDKLVSGGVVIRPTLKPRTCSYRCQCVQWDHLNAKNIVLKIRPLWLCEIAWSPWQPIMRFERMGCTYKNIHISAATHPRILNLIPNLSLDMARLFVSRICKEKMPIWLCEIAWFPWQPIMRF